MNRNNSFHLEDDTYLCLHESSGSKQSLCEDGDEGGPLLCPPLKKNKEKGGGGSGELYLFGVTTLVQKEINCTNPDNNFMFSYLPKYEFWINLILNKMKREDALQNDKLPEPDYSTEMDTTTIDDSLPSYYDTEEYERTRKRWLRCDGDRKFYQNNYFNSFAFLNKRYKTNVNYVSTAAIPLGRFESSSLIGIVYFKLIIWLISSIS